MAFAISAKCAMVAWFVRCHDSLSPAFPEFVVNCLPCAAYRRQPTAHCLDPSDQVPPRRRFDFGFAAGRFEPCMHARYTDRADRRMLAAPIFRMR
jgi:hypothetical protein